MRMLPRSPGFRSSSRPRVVALLALALSFVFSASAEAQEDLSRFFGPGMFVNDVRIFDEDNGDRFESRLVSLKPWRGSGQKAKFVRRTNGKKTGTAVSFSRNGKSYPEVLKIGRIKVVPAKQKPVGSGRPPQIGQREKWKVENRVTKGGSPFAKEKLKGSSTPRALESVSTPRRSYPEALRVDTSERSMLRYEKSDARVVIKTNGTNWYAEGFGLVRRTSRTRTYVNGRLEEDTGTRVLWLDAATLNGASLFDPPPKDVPTGPQSVAAETGAGARVSTPREATSFPGTHARARARLAPDVEAPN